MFTVRRHGVFQQSSDTRISVVVAFSHPTLTDHRGQHQILAIHNPFARNPLPLTFLPLEGVRHVRRVECEPGFFKLVYTPSEAV